MFALLIQAQTTFTSVEFYICFGNLPHSHYQHDKTVEFHRVHGAN